MKRNNYIVLLVLGLIFPNALMAAEQGAGETSEWLLFLGRFHPLILHLPIGAFLVSFLMDITGRIKKDYPVDWVRFGLGFSAISAIVACILGYFLSLEEGYGERVLSIHLWLGVLTAILLSILFLISKKKEAYKGLGFFLLMIVSVVSISAAGHYGSILTHGEDFLTEYLPDSEVQDEIMEIDSLEIYKDVVAVIIDDKCRQCHNDTKKKGELSLIHPEGILAGGENGDVVKANDPQNSTFYTHALLPVHDDLHMPPEGKKQLTKNELWILKYWIQNGLSFKHKVADLSVNDSLTQLLNPFLINNSIPIQPASDSDIQDLVDRGFRVTPLISGQGGLHVKYIGSELKRADVKALKKLKEQIVELDLSNSRVEDSWLGHLDGLGELVTLRLDNTNITDKGLRNLDGLSELSVLNLFNTSCTIDGLEVLLETTELSKVFLWNEGIDQSESQRLAQTYSVQIASGVFEGFVEPVAIQPAQILTEESLFIDTLRIALAPQMRGAAIRYTLNGEAPDSTSALYEEPLLISETTELKTRSYKKGWLPSEVKSKMYTKVSYKVETYSIKDEPEVRYPGSSKLYDLKEGTEAFKDGRWTGYLGYHLETVVDLKEPKEVSKIGVNCLENIGNWILLPEGVDVFTSMDSINFQKIGSVRGIGSHKDDREDKLKTYTVDLEENEGRYLKVVVRNPGVLPGWHPGAGNASWIFIDEIKLW